MITSAIILLISGISFGAGFLKEGVANEIEETKIAITNDESLVGKINDKISDILIMDHLTLLDVRNKIETAKNIVWDWSLNYDTLTAVERSLLQGQIKNYVNAYEWSLRLDSTVGGLVQYFKIQGNDADYPIADFSTDGFDYSISKLRFDDYDSTYNLSKLVDMDDFLRHYQFRNDTELAPILAIGSPTDRTWIANLDIWINLFRVEQYEIQERISNYTTNLATLEREVSYYTFGMTAITITIILATAMTNRISDKESEKEFSPIKAKVLENDKWLITKTKKWPMIMLLFALILSIAGLVIPPIIGILT